MQRYLIIKVLGEWWRLPVSLGDTPLTFKAMAKMNILGSQRLAQACDVIYDPESKYMIKNSNLNKELYDEISKGIWWLPIFEYESDDAFSTRLTRHQAMASET